MFQEKELPQRYLWRLAKLLLKATAYKGISTNDVLSEVNKILADDSPSNMFITAFYGVLDTRNGAFEFSNGGHNSPLLISNDGNVNQLQNIGGLNIRSI